MRGRLALSLLLFLAMLASVVCEPVSLVAPRVHLVVVVPSARVTTAAQALREMDADLLALLAWSEDVGAPDAVMWTAINRARRRGTSVLAEVLRPHQYHGLERGDPRAWRRAPADRAVLRRFRRRALRLLAGATADPTGGATHFHAAAAPAPPWAPTRRYRAGDSLFYVGTENNPRKIRTYAREGVDYVLQ